MSRTAAHLTGARLPPRGWAPTSHSPEGRSSREGAATDSLPFLLARQGYGNLASCQQLGTAWPGLGAGHGQRETQRRRS